MPILRVRDENGNYIPIPAIRGEKGDSGKSAYKIATEAGYTGTEAELAEDLAGISDKAKKAATPTAGNLAALDADGNPVDSGRKPNDIPSQEKLTALATRTEIFTHDDVFTVPDGVTSLRVMCYGGGGSGGAGSTSDGSTNYTGGGGGGGYYAEQNISVTPNERIPITIGLGGVWGATYMGETRKEHNGGATSFGTYLSADGGESGYNGSNTSDKRSEGGTGGSGGGGGYTNYANEYANGGRGYQFGGGGGGRCHPNYSQTAAQGGSMGGAGGANKSAGSAGIDTTNMDVPFPGPAPGGAATAYSHYGSGGGGGYGSAGGHGGSGGGGGGGYGGAGGDSYDDSVSSANVSGGGGGGGYGPSGKGGTAGRAQYDSWDTALKRPQDGGIGAGGGGGIYREDELGKSVGRGGDGICIVTYTLPI